MAPAGRHYFAAASLFLFIWLFEWTSAILLTMAYQGQPARDSRHKVSLLEVILSTVACLVLLFTGLFVLTGGSGSANQFGSFIAVLFFVFGFYGAALDILDLLDLLYPPSRQLSAHSPR